MKGVNAQTTCAIAALMIIASFLSSCAPVITHGPDVKAGFSGGVSAVLGNGPTYENGDDPGPFFFGATLASAAYGFRPTSNERPALRLGMQAPTTGTLAVDLYLQAPRKWLGNVTGGIGVLAEFADGRQMPYVQAGIKDRDCLGINVAVGYYSDRDSRAGQIVNERALVNWVSLEGPIARWATAYLHLGYATGHVRKKSTKASYIYVDEDRWVKMGGVTLEFHRPHD